MAPDACTLTGSYGIARRVVLTHRAPVVLTLVRHFLFMETLAQAQQVAISHGDTIAAVREVPPVLF
jgi:hypothetical protein